MNKLFKLINIQRIMMLNLKWKKKKKKKTGGNKNKSWKKIEDGEVEKNLGKKPWFPRGFDGLVKMASRKNIETSKASVTWRGNVAKGRVFGLIPAMQGMPRGNTMQYVSNVNILRLVESKYLPFTILYPLTLD